MVELRVPNHSGAGLEGTTLAVYSFVVKQGKPVGTRDVMRGAGLSSPSVAHRHLQKLESLGLLQRNEYGDYMVKEKTKVRGYVWIGRRLLPRMLIYAFAFMCVLLVEIVVLVFHLPYNDEVLEIFVLYLMLITTVAMLLFLVEGVLQIIRSKRGRSIDG